METKFSVLLSVYAKEKPLYLKDALNSIWQSQILKPNEIVIVKDGLLTAELEKVIIDFSIVAPVVIVQLQKNMGLGAALNVGLNRTSNEIVARMDSDDISASERFFKQINYFVENPEIDILSSWIDEFYGNYDNIISTRKLPCAHSEILKYSKKRCPLNHPAVVYKKSAVICAGGYLEFPLFEDYYLWARMLLHGAKFYNFPESLLLFRTDIETYRRRGGLKQLIVEIRLQILFRKMKFINTKRMSLNILIRSSVRLMPNFLRIRFYRFFLRP